MKKAYRNLIVFICCWWYLIVMCYVCYNFYTIIKIDALTITKKDSNSFKVSSLFNFDDARVTESFITSFDGNPICYEFIVDSCYQLSLTKIGKIRDSSCLKHLSFVDTFIKGKNNKRMCMTSSPIHFFPEFDSSFLPLEFVDSIALYVEGGIKTNRVNNYRIICYTIGPGSVIVTFNGHNSQDLYYSFDDSIGDEALLFFSIDTANVLFAGITNQPLLFEQM